MTAVQNYLLGYGFSKFMSQIAPLATILASVIFAALFGWRISIHKKGKAFNGFLTFFCILIGVISVLLVFSLFTSLYHTEPLENYEDYLYFGQTENGEAHGKGRLFDADRNLVYIGGFEHNKKSGEGREYTVITLRNKPFRYLSYEGTYKDGLYSGQGKLYSFDRESDTRYLCYEGDFRKGKYCGFGKMIAADGRTWTGAMYDNQSMGFTVFEDPCNENRDAIRFEGIYLNGEGNGFGEQYKNDVLIYSGNFTNGSRDGQGISYYEDGSLRYTGNWKEGSYSGQGTSYYKNGTMHYQGAWENGKYSGQGEEYNSDGTLKYKGSFLDGLYSGVGILHYKNKNNKDLIYEGEFSEGTANGYGKVMDINGTTLQEGQYKDGKYVQPDAS